MAKTSRPRKSKVVATFRHGKAKRTNIPTAEYQAVMAQDDRNPIQVAYERRNRDLDPQLVWRGKDHQDWLDLVMQAPPLFIQEKVHPKVLIDDLRQRSRETKKDDGGAPFQADLFADFNGLPSEAAATEFYQHDANWSNRMILGDSLQVMASLAEREGLRGKVQCIYIDPPYGIKFNSNFQWSTKSRDVKDGKGDHITREPEQVKAFRDTWRDGIHSYLTYLRDRLTVARDLLTESGSVFVQISDENVHLLRTLVDEVFSPQNAVATIVWKKGAPSSKTIKNAFNYILWYAKDVDACKVRKLYRSREVNEGSTEDPKKLALWGELPDGITRPLTTVPRPTISLDSDLRTCIRSYRRGGTGYVQRKEWRRWGREGSPWGDRSGPSGRRSREGPLVGPSQDDGGVGTAARGGVGSDQPQVRGDGSHVDPLAGSVS